MYPDPRLFLLLVEAEPEKFHFRHVYSLRLVSVHLQIQFSFDEVRDAFFDSICCFSCLDEYHKVISIPHKPESSLSEFDIQPVQHDIAQQW